MLPNDAALSGNRRHRPLQEQENLEMERFVSCAHSTIYRSANIPLFVGESIRDLEARTRQTHDLLGQYEKTQLQQGQDQPAKQPLFTVVTPSQPGPLLAWKRTCSDAFSKSERTVDTAATTGSLSVVQSVSSDGRPSEHPGEGCCRFLGRQDPSSEYIRSVSIVSAACTNSDNCDWGYYVDVADEDDLQQPTPTARYRPFLNREIQKSRLLDQHYKHGR